MMLGSRRPALWIMFLATTIPTQAHGQQPAKPARPTPNTIQHASWTPYAESFVGLKEAQFREMGLRKLTADEFLSVLAWAYDLQTSATQKAVATTPSYSCGRAPTDDPNTYSKARLFLSFNENTPSELASGIRQKLRGIQDLEIVYLEKEADLTVTFVSLENHLKGGPTTGYTISAVTGTPCEWRIGETKGTFRIINNHYLQVAGNAPDLVEGIVTTLDAGDIEDTRKSNAMWKRMYEQRKKPNS